MSEALDVLAVFAHPDDAELVCGGALIKSSRMGERTGIVDLTRGERATLGSAEIRKQEAQKAAEILGLAVRRNAGIPDAAIDNTVESRTALVEILRDLRPRVVVTHARGGRHPDHRIAAQLVYDACFLSGLKGFPAAGKAHRPEKLVHAMAFREDVVKPTFVIDISDQIEAKLAALACYESQFAQGLVQSGEVFPGGDRPLFDQIRAKCAHHGSLIRVAYGEPFWTRETVEMESLGQLEVATF
ncbi:MAG: bacillithiol biosynthesis deacetylase BshB1 [Longimicrobiales bacterium]